MLLAAFSVALAADDSREIRKDYPVTKLSERIHVVYGPLGGPTVENQGFRTNGIFVVTKAGVVAFDPCGSVYIGRMLLRKIRTVTDKPVIAVFNTHAHGDHFLGNQAFKDANPEVDIYAHATTIKKIAEGEGERWLKLFNNATGNAVAGTRVVPPNKAVKNADEIKIGELTFRIHHTGPAHTDNDIMVEIPEEKALLTGDIVRVGLVGISNASFKGNITAIDHALGTGARLFIPGHGIAGDQHIAKDYRDFMSILRTTVARHYEAGLSDFDIKPKAVEALARYKDWKLFDENIGRLVSLTYLEIEAEAFQ